MTKHSHQTDYLLIGAGVMSATLGVFLKILDPKCNIIILERLRGVALESSAAWNNAGTGHAGMCELNYTPEKEDGTVDCTKAFKINEQFEISKQFWAWMVANNYIPGDFIKPTPHMSFVQGEKDIAFLEERVRQLTKNPMFETMKFSKDPKVLAEWIPLMMNGRPASDKVAATHMVEGADVNFGTLTRYLVKYLTKMEGVTMMSGWEVNDIDALKGKAGWEIEAKNRKSGSKRKLNAKFVFIGAGGKALTLLEKSGIPEGKGYGGFPVSGQWLRCNNPKVIAAHHAKVYGKAAEGAPPMSVPHLDTRTIREKQELLFGPFAGFSTKFLKHGSYFDLPGSLRLTNLIPMIRAGLDNLSLTKYLIEQVRLKPEERLDSLKDFYPEAKMEDWDLAIAGQRVQIIKKDEKEGGVLAFGTEVVHSKDGSVAALLGASPGASTSVHIILNVLEKCFGHMMHDKAVVAKIKEMIPSFGHSLVKDGDMLKKIRKQSHEVLQLEMGI